MTKISKKTAYPIKTPIAQDYFVGTDSENNGKTVNFSFESASKLINEINGTPIVNYLFRTDVNIPLTVLTDGVFLSAENETSISSISKLYINKKNFSEVNLTELFQFISVNREVFLLKLRNSSNLNNAVYFKITGAVESESYVTLDVTIHLNNSAVTELVNFNVYFFDFELSSSDLAVSLPEFNKIVSQTGFTSTETQIIFNPTWVWLLKNVSYTNTSSVTKTINPTATGKKRIDVFVLNTSNTFQTISGAETTGSPVKPPIPIDTLEVTFCIVGDTGIENVEPIDLSTYATKSYVDEKDTALDLRITDLENADGGISDMVLASPQTVSGLKTFLNGMFGLRNFANTFTSFFANSNTASRTYTLPDRSGTLADSTDIASINTGKMNTPAGTVNYLSKFLTASTIGLSRLWDTGSKLGIGTSKTPTEDITFGNQTERTIGIEQSTNTNHGKDLISFAGRTINFVEGIGFQPLNFGNTQNFYGSIIDPVTQDVYVASSGEIFKRTAGSGTFIGDGASANAMFHRGMGVDNVGSIYVAMATGGFKKKVVGGVWTVTVATGSSGTPTAVCGDYLGNLYLATDTGLYKQTALTGSFVLVYAGIVRDITISPIDGSIYILAGGQNANEIRKQSAGTGSFNLIQYDPYGYGICASPTGDVYIRLGNGKLGKQTSGSGLFVDTLISLSFGGNVATSLAINSNGSIYAPISLTDIYFLDNNAVGTPNLDGGTKSERAGTGKGTGKSRWDVWTGQKTASGTNMQAPTKRLEVDELGALKLLTTHQYADNATAITAGLEVGSLYWNANGDLKIVI